MYKSRLILLAALVIGASLVFMQAASAVGMHKAGAGAGMAYMERMTKALNLTPDQVAKIQAIDKDAKAKRDAVLANTSLSPDQRRSQLADLRKSRQAQVMSVLTPDQQVKYKSFLAKMEAKKASVKSALNLTADQKARIASIRESSRTQIAAVRADTSLTPAQKVAKIKDIRLSAKKQMDQVLTPEQRTKLGTLRPHKVK